MRANRFGSLSVIAACLVALAAVPAGTPQKPKEQAKLYEKALLGMTGQPFGKVISAIEDWKFEALDAWEAESPTARDVGKHDRNKVKFTKKEFAGIFGPGGKFRVVVYNKLVGAESTSMGAIDAIGRTPTKDLTIRVESFTVIRAVFKDNVLVHSRVWPVIDQSAFAGGTFIHR